MDTEMFELTQPEIAAYYGYRVATLPQKGHKWRGPCPVHKGKDDNFAVDPVTGRYYCHSQCSRGGGVIGLEMELTGAGPVEARATVESIVGRPIQAGAERRPSGNRNAVIEEYAYKDSTGSVAYVKRRHVNKKFSFGNYDHQGNWIAGIGDTTRVPYNLPALRDAESVFYVEGEKDVETLRRVDRVATTAGGAKDWRRKFAKEFRAKQVAVFYDNDDPGKRHAPQVCEDIFPLASEVRLIDLPGIQAKGDISDWFAGGGSAEELDGLVSGTAPLSERSFADRRQAWDVMPGSGAAQRLVTDVFGLPSVWGLEARQEWMVEGMLACGSVTLVAAASGAGKSWLAYGLGGAVAHGRPFVERTVKRAKVLYVDAENPLYVVKERLRMSGVSETPDIAIWGGWSPESPRGPLAAAIVRFAKDHKGLIIFDSFINFLEGSEQDSADVRRYMNGFRRLANLGASVLILHHTGKGGGVIPAVPWFIRHQGFCRFRLQSRRPAHCR